MPERPNAPDRTTLEQAGPTAKYTEPLPLDEYDKLPPQEKAAYINDMVDLKVGQRS